MTVLERVWMVGGLILVCASPKALETSPRFLVHPTNTFTEGSLPCHAEQAQRMDEGQAKS